MLPKNVTNVTSDVKLVKIKKLLVLLVMVTEFKLQPVNVQLILMILK